MAYTFTFDVTKPASGDSPTGGDDQIRDLKDGLVERLNVDMEFGKTGSEVSDDTKVGKHKKITFLVQGSDPTLLADEGALYTKAVSTKSELHWKDEDANVVQLTSGGALATQLGTKLELPDDTSDTTEGNIRYVTATDVVEYRDAAAWIQLAKAANVGRIAMGKYTGDGAGTQAITGVGFQPDAVLVLPMDSVHYAHLRTKDMASTNSKSLASIAQNPDAVRVLDADGFTVGNGTGGTTGAEDNMNVNSTEYAWIAFKISSAL